VLIFSGVVLSCVLRKSFSIGLVKKVRISVKCETWHALRRRSSSHVNRSSCSVLTLASLYVTHTQYILFHSLTAAVSCQRLFDPRYILGCYVGLKSGVTIKMKTVQNIKKCMLTMCCLFQNPLIFVQFYRQSSTNTVLTLLPKNENSPTIVNTGCIWPHSKRWGYA